MLKYTRLIVFFTLCVTCLPLDANVAVDNKTKRSIITYEQTKRRFDYFFYEALNLKNSGKFDAAYDLFNHCLSIDSTNASVLFELSSFYVRMNNPVKVLETLQKATLYSPGNFTYQMTYASATLAFGQVDKAIEEYNQLLTKYPNNADINYYLAQALYQKGEFQKSIDAFNALEAAYGMNEGISMQKYSLYNELGESEKALNELDRLVIKFPDEPRYMLLLGDIYLSRKDTTMALSYYERAYKVDADNPNYIVSMANYYEATGNKQAAEHEIELALMNPRLDVEIKVGILATYIQRLQQSQKHLEGVDVLFETLLNQHPEETRLKMMYAGLLVFQQKTEEARFQYQVVTEMDPENQSAWQQLLDLSLKENKTEDVIAICEKCVELFPSSPEYYFYLGIGYYQVEKYTEAIDIYQKGISIIPKENVRLISDFYGQIADIHFQINEPESAYAYYDEALKYNENNIAVLNNYSYYLSLEKKDLQKAERMSGLAVKLDPDNATYLDTYAWVFFMQGNYSLARIYVENALSKDKTNSPELINHYGDILFMLGEETKALEQWKLAKEKGSENSVLDKKIKEKKYIEAPAPSTKTDKRK